MSLSSSDLQVIQTPVLAASVVDDEVAYLVLDRTT